VLEDASEYVTPPEGHDPGIAKVIMARRCAAAPRQLRYQQLRIVCDYAILVVVAGGVSRAPSEPPSVGATALSVRLWVGAQGFDWAGQRFLACLLMAAVVPPWSAQTGQLGPSTVEERELG